MNIVILLSYFKLKSTRNKDAVKRSNKIIQNASQQTFK